MSRAFAVRRVRGAALPVVLLLLIALTLPALVILRNALVNEKMAAASVDHARAFQLAEAGLVEAEAFAVTKPTPPPAGCSAGICATPSPAVEPAWTQTDFWNDGGSGYRLGAADADGLRSRFVVEYMGVSKGLDQDCTTGGDVSPDAACNDEAFRYRLTVLGRSPTGAETILQTSYLVP